MIIAAHSYGIYIHPDQVLNIGIQNLSDFDVRFAKEKGLKIKLIAAVRKVNDREITLSVLPQFVKPVEHLYNVENEYNGVEVQAAFSDRQYFIGKGAGGHPTGMAVLSDISALRYNYRYEYKRHLKQAQVSFTTNVDVEVYLRFSNHQLVDTLGFKSISERYYSDASNYVIGIISLQSILKNKEKIIAEGAFIANTGRIITD